MSHTILKAASDRTSHSTLYTELSGRLEVYWEEMRRPGNKEARRHRCWPTDEGHSTASKNATHEGYSPAPRHETFSLNPKQPKRNSRWFF
jgi:hypothetical protein